MRVLILFFTLLLYTAFSLYAYPGTFGGAGRAGLAEWTVMVYLNGKNDREAAALREFNEMELAGSSGMVNVIVEAGRSAAHDSSQGDWRGVRRYVLRRDADTASIGSDLVADLGQRDMGAWRELADFGSWAKRAYPARKYALIVWGHGNGWMRGVGGAKGISFDYESRSFIDPQGLFSALSFMGGVDVYASDADVMQMAEVAYELRNVTGFIVGSEEMMPPEGFPYDRIIGFLNSNPLVSPEGFSWSMVDTFGNYYVRSDMDTTLSALRSSELAELAARAGAMVSALTASSSRDSYAFARKKAISFSYPDSVDLCRFAEILAESSPDKGVYYSAGELAGFIRSRLMVNHRYSENSLSWTEPGGEGWSKKPFHDYSDSRGISVYLPENPPVQAYEPLSWSRGASWWKFIGWINGWRF